MKRAIPILILMFSSLAAVGVEPPVGEVAFRQALLDLGTELRLMCVAAHPDDEDGATLSMYRKRYGYHTIAVLATRGEGGQNEIGPELYDDLAVIRTDEMMGAAAVEDAELHFLNYPEFGYSKTLEETLAIWGHDWALERMVRVIRLTRPDVIISNHGTRVDHGHHQGVGAILREAFEAAGDPAKFPEHEAEGLAPWQPARLFLRSWRETGRDVTVNISELDPWRGKTYAEIAAEALDVHNSQGMDFVIQYYLTGRPVVRYHIERESPGGVSGGGSVPAPGGVLFEGLMDRVTPEARALSVSTAPRASLRGLLLANAHRGPKWNAAAAAALDLRLDVNVSDGLATPGQAIAVDVRVSDFGAEDAAAVTAVRFDDEAGAPWLPFADSAETMAFDGQRMAGGVFTTAIRPDAPVFLPRHLHVFTPGYKDPQGRVTATVEVDGTAIDLTEEVFVDMAPAATLRFADSSYVVPMGMGGPAAMAVDVTYHGRDAFDDTIHIACEPPLPGMETIALPVRIAGEEQRRLVSVPLALPEGAAAGLYTVTATLARTGQSASVPMRVMELTVPEGIRIGLIESYDTTIRTTLRQLGIDFDLLADSDVSLDALRGYTTVIADMRAYFERPAVAAGNGALLDYAKGGGHLLVLYHKTFEWDPGLAAYPIRISRNRTTREDAAVTILAPAHPFFTTPHAIGASDWEGWIQERGLYFADQWDERYTPLVATIDPDEDIPPGAWLTAEYGDGTYTYSALVWYRQLRALNPGALRLFVNMLAL